MRRTVQYLSSAENRCQGYHSSSAISRRNHRQVYRCRNQNYKERRSALNGELKVIAQEAGLNELVTYEENGTKYTKPLYELLHTHSARHTFSTIMCRKGIPREDIIIATGHEDTQMLDKIYAHLTAKDKSRKVTNAFKKKLGDGIFDMGVQPEPDENEQKSVPDRSRSSPSRRQTYSTTSLPVICC